MSSMYEFENERAYTKFKRHVDESHERISANDINKLQTSVQKQELFENRTRDTAFQERIYTIFENNLFVNAMFVDYYENGNYVNLLECNGVSRDEEKQLVTLQPYYSQGVAASSLILSQYGPDAEMNDFLLIVNQTVPTGAAVKYFIQGHTGERWPIKENDGRSGSTVHKPMHLSENIKNGFKVIAQLTRNSLDEAPEINGFAVMYWDGEVEKQLGLTNPDLSRFP